MGHPHECVDPVVAVVGMVQRDPDDHPAQRLCAGRGGDSVTQIHTGTASNIIPEEAMFCATIRCFKPDVRELLKKRFHEIVEGHAAGLWREGAGGLRLGLSGDDQPRGRDRFRGDVAREIVGPGAVDARANREMGSEDFSPTCWRRGRGPIFSWAPGRGRGCIIRP
jgi:metal-dependent amidase/aminoacylase/carboxypeptidase family protein